MGKLSASVVACWMVFTTGLAPASVAEPREHRSFIGDSSLVIQVKSEHKCKWKRVCHMSEAVGRGSDKRSELC